MEHCLESFPNKKVKEIQCLKTGTPPGSRVKVPNTGPGTNNSAAPSPLLKLIASTVKCQVGKGPGMDPWGSDWRPVIWEVRRQPVTP